MPLSTLKSPVSAAFTFFFIDAFSSISLQDDDIHSRHLSLQPTYARIKDIAHLRRAPDDLALNILSKIDAARARLYGDFTTQPRLYRKEY